MALWWVGDENQATANYVKVSELADCQCENSDMLNDIGVFLTNYTQRYNCSSDFVWKGMLLFGIMWQSQVEKEPLT